MIKIQIIQKDVLSFVIVSGPHDKFSLRHFFSFFKLFTKENLQQTLHSASYFSYVLIQEMSLYAVVLY